MNQLLSGTHLGRYEVRSQLGAGGMGEVYLAQDMGELERTVAIKILPAALASDQQRMQRFIQEAKTVSALNHPNILTIHEIGEAEGTRFIVTEYIDGVTLRQHMSSKRVKLHEVLDIAMQVAAALDAAHEARVVHRDIKPENIMVRRRDHIVKVLDFGLAKPAENPEGTQREAVDMEAGTKVLVHTEPGLVMGTVSYMSPEQSQGSARADWRTDIWSLGVVLYEMVAGQLPFEGKDIHRQIIAIQESEPFPLSRYAEGVPNRLEEIVEKALAKDREDRYQTAKDFLIDLRNLKRKLEVDAEIERTVPPELRSTTSGAKGRASDSQTAVVSQVAAHGVTVEQANSTSSAEYLVGEMKRHKRSVTVVLAALVLAFAGAVYLLFPGRSGKALDSIAVLPFVNASNDPNTEYLSDGIAETLINSLSQLQRLRVVARGTAFRYKGKEVDPQQVGRDLNVRAVMTGRVRQLGDALNIQVDLVDATTGAQLWGEEYNRKVSDILAVKQDISREITEKLRLRLSGAEQKQLTKRDTTNAEAYQLFLRGRYHWNKRTAEGLKKAIEQFEQAIGKDPSYALAYVGIADCYLVMEQYAGTPATETVPKARAAAEQALQIDNSLAEAHTSMASVNETLWKWDDAGEEYRRAISLNPNYPTARHWYYMYLVAMKRSDAEEQIRRAEELDPLSPVISINVAQMYLRKGETDRAIEQCKRIIELYPIYPGGYEILAKVYVKQRRYREAVEESSKAAELSGRASYYLGAMGYCYAQAGRRADALATLKELEAKYARRESPATDIATVHLGLGDKDQAFVWLEKAFETRSGMLMNVTYEEYFDLLRHDPRYADLVRRMGLQP